MQWVCQVFRPLDCLYTLNREWTLYKRLVTKSWPTKESDCHQQNSSLVLNLWCKDLVPQKRGKGNAVSVSSVSATGLSLYAEQRVDFVQEIGDKELTHKGVRLSPTKLFLSLKSVMQRLGSAKKRRRKCSECVRCFGHWTVFIRWTESGLCTGDWEDMNDKRRSVFYRKIIFCTTGSFSGCLSLRWTDKL